MTNDFQSLKETKIDSKEIYDGAILHVYKDTVTLPSGKTASREVARHVGAVGIVPMTEDGKVIVERQYRYPIDMVITEIPAGKLDSKSEDRLQMARHRWPF